MDFSEKKLRVIGYGIFTSIFFVFFMLEMFFSWKDENLWIKVLLITLLHTLLIWEPTRYFILFLRKRFPGSFHVSKRLVLSVATLIPYAFLLGFIRIFFEDYSNMWGVPVATFTTYSYTIGISLLFILLQLALYESIYFFSQWSKTQSEMAELKRLNLLMQLDSLKAQIQPHFLFNTFNTLIGLIEVDTKRAVNFTESLAFVYRYLLETSDKSLISLNEELQFARKYFSLLKTRYPEGLFLTDKVNGSSDFLLPPMSLQILIENAVKHNKVSKGKPLYIDISCNLEEEKIIVSNNVQYKELASTTGKGLNHLNKKFELLNLPHLEVIKDEETFCVQIPLIKTLSYESLDY